MPFLILWSALTSWQTGGFTMVLCITMFGWDNWRRAEKVIVIGSITAFTLLVIGGSVHYRWALDKPASTLAGPGAEALDPTPSPDSSPGPRPYALAPVGDSPHAACWNWQPNVHRQPAAVSQLHIVSQFHEYQITAHVSRSVGGVHQHRADGSGVRPLLKEPGQPGALVLAVLRYRHHHHVLRLRDPQVGTAAGFCLCKLMCQCADTQMLTCVLIFYPHTRLMNVRSGCAAGW